MFRNIIIAAAAAATMFSAPASADDFAFTYGRTDSDGTIVAASGIFTTSTTLTTVNGRSAYTILSTLGQRNGIAFSMLAPDFPTTAGGADNYLFATGVPFTDLGVSFQLADGNFVNLFDSGTDGIFEFAASDIAGTLDVTGGAVTFVLTPIISEIPPAAGAAPEPATWTMMIVGFGAAGIALRRRRAISAKVSYA